MSRTLIRVSIAGLAFIAVAAIAWLIWPRTPLSERRQESDELVQMPPPNVPSPAESRPAPASQGESRSSNTPQPSPTPNPAQQELQRELERLATTQQYRDMLGRQKRGEQLAKSDLELLLKASDIKGRMIDEPALEKNTTYPPDDAKTQEMWQWWRKMKDADPNFEYKRPIAFYGKVVDEAGNPIPDASIVASIAGPDGDKEVALKSNSQGLFSIKDLKGKFITVEMDKRGYGRGPQSYGTFEFAEFFSERFYQPDPSNPVVFVLPRLNR